MKWNPFKKMSQNLFTTDKERMKERILREKNHFWPIFLFPMVRIELNDFVVCKDERFSIDLIPLFLFFFFFKIPKNLIWIRIGFYSSFKFQWNFRFLFFPGNARNCVYVWNVCKIMIHYAYFICYLSSSADYMFHISL